MEYDDVRNGCSNHRNHHFRRCFARKIDNDNSGILRRRIISNIRKVEVPRDEDALVVPRSPCDFVVARRRQSQVTAIIDDMPVDPQSVCKTPGQVGVDQKAHCLGSWERVIRLPLDERIRELQRRANIVLRQIILLRHQLKGHASSEAPDDH